MNNKLFQLKTYITYWLDAVDEHSLHSPYFFDLYSRSLKAKDVDMKSTEIESFRQQLLTDHSRIDVNDLGAGSNRSRNNSRTINDIARTSLSPKKYSLLYQNIIKRFDSPVVLELGTSLGINTLYLARPDQSHVTTFEGASAIAERARKIFALAGSNNITLILGNIEDTLPHYLRSVNKIDFVFLDANHRYTPTINYFQQLLKKSHQHSVFVLDDIHYSPEMENAWNTIKNHGSVYATADLYRCGIVFFDPSLNNQHVVLQF
ncbi:MAG: SAM-dependent methyltransferase [Marivirga sp.]|nr:SAM-dependent methyltransferase [Marivirga sp.]